MCIKVCHPISIKPNFSWSNSTFWSYSIFGSNSIFWSNSIYIELDKNIEFGLFENIELDKNIELTFARHFDSDQENYGFNCLFNTNSSTI